MFNNSSGVFLVLSVFPPGALVGGFLGVGVIILPAHMFCVASHILFIDSSVWEEIWWGSGVHELGGRNLLAMGLGLVFFICGYLLK